MSVDPINISIDAGDTYTPTYEWGRGLVIRESDAIGDWLEPGVTVELIDAAIASDDERPYSPDTKTVIDFAADRYGSPPQGAQV
jgi:hypothetical protein